MGPEEIYGTPAPHIFSLKITERLLGKGTRETEALNFTNATLSAFGVLIQRPGNAGNPRRGAASWLGCRRPGSMLCLVLAHVAPACSQGVGGMIVRHYRNVRRELGALPDSEEDDLESAMASGEFSDGEGVVLGMRSQRPGAHTGRVPGNSLASPPARNQRLPAPTCQGCQRKLRGQRVESWLWFRHRSLCPTPLIKAQGRETPVFY